MAYCSNFDKLPQAMKEIRPTVFVGVPRVYEKIRQAVEQKSNASPVKKRMLAWALSVGARSSRHGLWRPPALILLLETRQQARLQQSARSLRRPCTHLGLRRRTSWHRHRKMVRLGRHRRVGGLRPHGNLARDCAQQPRCPAHGRGGQAASERRTQICRRRRTAGARAVGLCRLLAEARSQCRMLRRRGLVPHRRYRPPRRQTAFSTSPTARRSCSRPPAANSSRRSPSKTS